MNKTGTRPLETERLILRRFTPADAEDMYRNWASDPEVTRFLTWPAHSSLEITRRVLGDWLAQYEKGDYFNWAIVPRELGEPIGSITVVKVREEIEAAEVGYCMSRAWWGQGIMPEALKAVMDYLFATVGLNRVEAFHDANNPKSGRVMDKAGMKREGVLRQAARNNQGICDQVWHAMLRSEWENGRERM